MTYASAFFPDTDSPAVAARLQEAAHALGYAPFNPFAGLTGRAYPAAIRLFVAPARGGWARVLGEWDADLLPELARSSAFVFARLDGERGRVEAWKDGAALSVDIAFTTPLIRPVEATPARAVTALDDLVSALPESIQAMNRHPAQAEKLIGRLSDSVLMRAGGADQQAAARALVTGGERWDSSDGRAILSALSALAVPDPRHPDFASLREAYALHARRQRRPNAALLPGDAETLAKLPDALDYTPVYAGKG